MKKRLWILALLPVMLCLLTGRARAEKFEAIPMPREEWENQVQLEPVNILPRPTQKDIPTRATSFARNPYSAYAENFMYPEARTVYYALVEEMDRMLHVGGSGRIELPVNNAFRIAYLEHKYDGTGKDMFTNFWWVLHEEHPELYFWVSKLQVSAEKDAPMVITVIVDSRYRRNGNSEELNADHSKIASIRLSEDRIRVNASSIRSRTDLSIRDRLILVRDLICLKASYVEDSKVDSTAHQLPEEQMWNVFDDDPATGLVCAGYAELFQHMCSLVTQPGDDTICFYVRGYSPGNHAWNVVRMKGGNYIVDMTAVDTDDRGPFVDYFLQNQDKNWGEKSEAWSEEQPSLTYITIRNCPSAKTGYHIKAGDRRTYRTDTPEYKRYEKYAYSVYKLGNQVHGNLRDFNVQNALNSWTADGRRYRKGDGTYAIGKLELDGKLYLFDNMGVRCLSGTVVADGNFYYLDGAGNCLTGTHVIDGKEYYFHPSGEAAQNEWVGDKYYGDQWYWLAEYDPITRTLFHWVYKDGQWYCETFDGERAYSCWMRDFQGWCYLGGDGTVLTNCWMADNTGWCYLDGSGHMLTNGWAADESGWCYLDGSGHMAYNTWAEDNSGWCYVGGSGHVLTECWVEDYAGWRYLDGSGHILTNGWAADESGWCYLDGEGLVLTNNWAADNAGWCYLGGDGHMLYDCWAEDNSGWCYLDGSGHALTNGWAEDNTGWCYLDGSGHVLTNDWAEDNTGWCYLDGSGHVTYSSWVVDFYGWCYVGADGHLQVNSWIGDSYGWRYLGGDGHVLHSCWVADNTGWCYLGADGYVMHNAWVADQSGWCYVGDDGYPLTECWAEDGADWCYLGADGHMVRNCWAADSTGWCYLGDDGHAVTNCWVQDNVDWCYVGGDGRMLTECWVQDSQGWCYMDQDGHILRNGWAWDTQGQQYLDWSGHAV